MEGFLQLREGFSCSKKNLVLSTRNLAVNGRISCQRKDLPVSGRICLLTKGFAVNSKFVC